MNSDMNVANVRPPAIAMPMQIPIGLEANLKGVVDLIEMKAYYFEGDNGDDMIEKEIPAELVDQANEYREKLIDCCADYSDEIMEKAMEGQYGVDDIDKALIKKTIREATIRLDITPVFMGSAHKNIGVQKLLDGVTYDKETTIHSFESCKLYEVKISGAAAKNDTLKNDTLKNDTLKNDSLKDSTYVIRTSLRFNSNVRVWSTNSSIVIENAPVGSKFAVTDLNGRVLASSRTSSAMQEVRINSRGNFLVIIGNRAYKVTK